MARKAVVGSLVVELTSDSVRFIEGMNRADKRLGKFERRMKQLSASMTKYVTLPLIGMGGLAFKAAVDFESAFAGVEKTVDGTASEMAALRHSILDMSADLPHSVQRISAVAEAAGQLGIAREDVLDFTRTMLDLGVSTDMSAEEGAMSMARFAAIMQTPTPLVRRLSSALVGLGNNSKATEREILELGLRLAGSGKQVDMTEADVLGLAAGLRSVGVEAEAGGTAFSRVMVEIAKAVDEGGEALGRFATTAGMTSAAFSDAWRADAASALVVFLEGLGRVKEEGGSVFQVLEALGLENVRVRDALLRASGAGDLFRKSLAQGNKDWAENVALAEEANRRYGTTASRLQQLNNKLNRLAVIFGEKLLPVFESIERVIGPALDAFADMDDETQEFLTTVAVGAAASGPIMRLLTIISRMRPETMLVVGALAVAGIGLKDFADKANRAADELEDLENQGLLKMPQAVAPPIDVVGTRPAEVVERTTKALEGIKEPGRSFQDMLETWAKRFEQFDLTVQDWGDHMADVLADALMGWRAWGDAIRSVVDMVISDLIRLQIQASITQPLADWLNAFLRFPSGLGTQPYGPEGGPGVSIGPGGGAYIGGVPQSMGAAPMQVNITNNAGEMVKVSATPTAGGASIVIDSAIHQFLASGKADGVMSARYGANRRPVGR